jgi:hypothetical protein
MVQNNSEMLKYVKRYFGNQKRSIVKCDDSSVHVIIRLNFRLELIYRIVKETASGEVRIYFCEIVDHKRQEATIVRIAPTTVRNDLKIALSLLDILETTHPKDFDLFPIIKLKGE